MSSRMDSKLMEAAFEGDLARLDAALAKGADPGAVEENHWRTPAMQACFARSHGCVLSLAKAGADLDAKDINGWTAAMFAAHRDSLECLAALAFGGADFSIATPDGATAMDIALEASNFQSAEAIKALLAMPKRPKMKKA